ncbi:hypothetical protein [Streptomyces sp. NPDC058424]|uniref:hypothetical protein n=1 Tax=Streptomyces sp. NPDC058424 TaxID=3346491 RepID=UPI00364978E4
MPETAAFFRATNAGGAPDRLLKVTSPAVAGEISLSRYRMIKGASAYRGNGQSAGSGRRHAGHVTAHW